MTANHEDAANREMLPFYKFYIDRVEHKTEKTNLVGNFVRAHLPEERRNYQLYLEQTDVDRLFRDDETVDIKTKPAHFYSVPNHGWGG
jgi:hypothetical protein